MKNITDDWGFCVKVPTIWKIIEFITSIFLFGMCFLIICLANVSIDRNASDYTINVIIVIGLVILFLFSGIICLIVPFTYIKVDTLNNTLELKKLIFRKTTLSVQELQSWGIHEYYGGKYSRHLYFSIYINYNGTHLGVTDQMFNNTNLLIDYLDRKVPNLKYVKKAKKSFRL